MTDLPSRDDTTRLLTEIRDDQRRLLVLFETRQDNANALQARAEAIQDRSAKIVGTIQRVVPVMIVVVMILIGYVSWLLFRIMHR